MLAKVCKAYLMDKDRIAGNPSLEAWKVRAGAKVKPGHNSASCWERDVDDDRGEEMDGQRSMVQQVPLTSIADSVVTLPEAPDMPPGELHSQHVAQPGQSWDQWPTNSLWGALAGTPLRCMILLRSVLLTAASL